MLRSWTAGRATIGAACKVPSAIAAESVAAAGFDYVYVDQQHGVFDSAQLLTTLQVIAAAGADPLTRVPVNRPEQIHRALDFGAIGVIVPLVETAADASRAVEACHYPPHGARSYGVLRPNSTPSVDGSEARSGAACIVLVETEKGLANLDAIARTEGVNAIMVGPQDLALSLGIKLEGEWLRTPELLQAIELIRAACQTHGLAAGIGATNGADAADWLRRGFQMVNLGNDLAYIHKGLTDQLDRARSALR